MNTMPLLQLRNECVAGGSEAAGLGGRDAEALPGCRKAALLPRLLALLPWVRDVGRPPRLLRRDLRRDQAGHSARVLFSR